MRRQPGRSRKRERPDSLPRGEAAELILGSNFRSDLVGVCLLVGAGSLDVEDPERDAVRRFDGLGDAEHGLKGQIGGRNLTVSGKPFGELALRLDDGLDQLKIRKHALAVAPRYRGRRLIDQNN